MEFLDAYNEEKKFLGAFDRDYVHTEGLWHNTIHCWLFDREGNVYFQIRTDENKLYTTASGHVLAGETITEAFGREIKEELGITVRYEKAILVKTGTWQMDKEKNGKIIKDRVLSNIYVCEYEGNFEDGKFDSTEILGIVKMNGQKVLELFKNEKGEIPATFYFQENGKTMKTKKNVNFTDFLIFPHENAIDKYGYIIDKIQELTDNNVTMN